MIAAEKNERLTPIVHAMVTYVLRRHFARMYVRCSERINVSTPTLYLVNHSHWWDPLFVLWLNHVYLRQDAYVMLQEKARPFFPFLKEQGLFTVDPDHYQEWQAALEVGSELLSARFRSLWVLGQGEVVHQDARPVRFMPGMGSLLEKCEQVQVVPVAIYTSFTQKRPDVYLHLMDPLLPDTFVKGHRRQWIAACEKELALELDALRERVIANRLSEYELAWNGYPSLQQNWIKLREQLRQVYEWWQRRKKGRSQR
ncbi:lysophospholipid acyltransferase family protein [Laceyella putida]|uniref:Lysophospholipid acyltransferase family protein n=1 Tax=Laceyella putida TaxID=110101 RepID=A0ABW2RKJ2_9BACL